MHRNVFVPCDDGLLSDGGYFIHSREDVILLLEFCKRHLKLTQEKIDEINNKTWAALEKEWTAPPKGNHKTSPRKGFIYLVRNNENGLIKIGFSKKPSTREKTLQSQEPNVEMIFKHPGTQKFEMHLHRTFKDYRIRGEWFKLDDEYIEIIKRLCQE